VPVPLLSTALVPGPDQVVVRLTGEIDLSTVEQLRRALLDAAEAGTARVVVDVAQATFWDCSGLHELAVFTDELARAGRQCRIVRAIPATRRLIGLADYAPLLQLDGPLDDPNVARAAEGPAVPLRARSVRTEVSPRPPVSERPAPPRRRALDLLLRTPVAAVAGRRWS
jgi:anti-anti-sigma factor